MEEDQKSNVRKEVYVMRKRMFSDEQIVEMANRYIETDITMRQLAKECGTSKATIQRYLAVELKNIDHGLWKQTQDVAAKKKYEGEKKGGQAKRRKE